MTGVKDAINSFKDRADNMVQFANEKKENAESERDKGYWQGISFAWKQAKESFEEDIELYATKEEKEAIKIEKS